MPFVGLALLHTIGWETTTALLYALLLLGAIVGPLLGAHFQTDADAAPR